jgi:hypothetical protein
MATLNLGKIGIVNKGDYSAGTYKKLEIVKLNGVVYICDVESTTNAPPHSDWYALVSDGELAGSVEDLTITGSITEQTAVATDVLEPDNGTIQYRTLTANTTFTDDLAEGQTLTLYVTNAGYTITYPTVSWDSGSEPTLGTTDRLYFEKVNGTLYGFLTGSF